MLREHLVVGLIVIVKVEAMGAALAWLLLNLVLLLLRQSQHALTDLRVQEGLPK
jgi:hypothetical protein